MDNPDRATLIDIAGQRFPVLASAGLEAVARVAGERTALAHDHLAGVLVSGSRT